MSYEITKIFKACGNSAFLTGSFSMIAKEFPDNVATMFAILETFFGIGKYKELTFDFAYIFVYNFCL